MNPRRLRSVTSRLATLPPGPAKQATDADLLTRFLDHRDEAAFESLVGRHLAGVRAICGSVLRDANDADDAAQATFLVLVRRAASVRNRLAVGGWLCRVAWRAANRLREENARRARRDAVVAPDTLPATAPTAGDTSDLRDALGDEVRLLPEQYRTAVLLCYAAGVSTAEAAAQLGWPKGTLLTRLAWARKRLRGRLTKRGLALTGGFTAAFTGQTGVAGPVFLTARIADAAMALAFGDRVGTEVVSERIQSLTEGVVRHMIGTKLKAAVGIGFLVVALLGLGLGRMTVSHADAAGPGDKKATATAPATPARGAEPKEPAKPDAEPRAEAPPAVAGPGNELVVRRPLGSYTREVPAYGRATLTFTENRLHIVASVRIEKTSFTVTAEADYSMNRESMVYGIITGVDITGGGDEEEAAELAAVVGGANDMPFAFRVRAEDDAISLKDLKFGPFGSPLLTENLFGEKDNHKETLQIIGIICGKYKLDPNPNRGPLPAPPAAPRKRTTYQGGMTLPSPQRVGLPNQNN